MSDLMRGLSWQLLADTGLLDEGVAAIASALRRNNSVSVLDLSRNPFGIPAMNEVAETMLINVSVTRSLDMRLTVCDERVKLRFVMC